MLDEEVRMLDEELLLDEVVLLLEDELEDELDDEEEVRVLDDRVLLLEDELEDEVVLAIGLLIEVDELVDDGGSLEVIVLISDAEGAVGVLDEVRRLVCTLEADSVSLEDGVLLSKDMLLEADELSNGKVLLGNKLLLGDALSLEEVAVRRLVRMLELELMSASALEKTLEAVVDTIVSVLEDTCVLDSASVLEDVAVSVSTKALGEMEDNALVRDAVVEVVEVSGVDATFEVKILLDDEPELLDDTRLDEIVLDGELVSNEVIDAVLRRVLVEDVLDGDGRSVLETDCAVDVGPDVLSVTDRDAVVLVDELTDEPARFGLVVDGMGSPISEIVEDSAEIFLVLVRERAVTVEVIEASVDATTIEGDVVLSVLLGDNPTLLEVSDETTVVLDPAWGEDTAGEETDTMDESEVLVDAAGSPTALLRVRDRDGEPTGREIMMERPIPALDVAVKLTEANSEDTGDVEVSGLDD